jgi:kumamolisin
MPRGFLSVADFARHYGQAQQNIAALQAYLAKYHISTTALPNGLVVQAQGTAGQFDQALGVQQKEYRLPPEAAHDGRPGRPGRDVHVTRQSPLPPNAKPRRANQADLPNTYLLPSDYATRYDLDPVYAAHGTGSGRTVGIVTLASVDPSVVGEFWASPA